MQAAGRALLREYLGGMTDLERQAWRKATFQERQEGLAAFIQEKLKKALEGVAYFQIPDDTATAASTADAEDDASSKLVLNIGTPFDPLWYVISVTADPSANLVVNGIDPENLQLFLAIVEAGAQIQHQIAELEAQIEYYSTRYWFETLEVDFSAYRQRKIFDLKEQIAKLEAEFAELEQLYNDLGFGELEVTGQARNPSPDMFRLRSSGKGLSAAIDALLVSFENGGGSGATSDSPLDTAFEFAAEWVLFGRLFRAVGSRLGSKLAQIDRRIEMGRVARTGRVGELAAGTAGPKIVIESITGTTKSGFRFPDKTDDFAREVIEVKNITGTLYFTNQLRDSLYFAMTKGYKFILKIGPNTKLSRPLEILRQRGLIEVVPI